MAERLKKFIAVLKKRRTPIGIVVLLAAVVALRSYQPLALVSGRNFA